MTTSAADLGMAPLYLPNGDAIWLHRDLIKAASLRQQATAARSLEQLAKELGSGDQAIAFGPGLPMAPANPAGTPPRLWNYPVGYNLQNQPRAYESFSFAALRSLSESYDIARLCIEERKARIRRLKWHIQPKAVADMPRPQVKERNASLAGAVQDVTGFFLSPDQETDFSSWLMEWLDLLFSVDAATLYRRPTAGGALYGLEIIDGATIKIIVDDYGRVPQDPLPAYDQVYLGVVQGQYTTAEMLYRPYWMRPDSPYGSPPIEWVVLAVNRALRRQTLDLSLYTEGNVPVGFMRVAKDLPASQIGEMQKFFDELLSGNDVSRSRIRFVPGGEGTGLDQLNPQPTTEAEQMLAVLTCAAYGVDPKSIGFMTGTGHAMGGKGMEEGVETRGIERDAEICDYIARTINQVIAEDLGQPELEIIFEGLQQAEDQLSKAQAEDLRIRNGSLGLDEARDDHDLDPVGLSIPFVVAGQTVVLVTDIAAMSSKEVAPTPPPVPFGGQLGAKPAAAEPGAKGDVATANAAPGKDTTDQSAGAPAAATKAAVDELRAWRTKAIRKGAGVPFETRAIAPELAAAIRTGLATAGDVDGVRAVFAKAGGAPADPFGSPRVELTSRTGSVSSWRTSSPSKRPSSRSDWSL